MIDNLIKSILGQINILVERRAPEELVKTLPNGQWELLKKSTSFGPPPTPGNPHAASNEMVSHLFNHADAIHSALQPHIDKHLDNLRSSPFNPPEREGYLPWKGTSLRHLHDHSVDAPVHPSLQVWGDQVEESTGQRPNFNTVNGARGALKQYLLNLPKGQIDLAHLNKLREESRQVPHQVDVVHGDEGPREQIAAKRMLSTQDMEEIVNHHVGGVASLKEIHDKNGGIGAVEALGRTMGADAPPVVYSGLKLHPQVYSDLMDLMRPGSHRLEQPTPEYDARETAYYRALGDIRKKHPNMDWGEQHAMAEQLVPPFEGRFTHTLPESTYNNSIGVLPEHQDAVDRTYEEMARNGSDESMKNHENAAIDRGLYRFKQHHGLK